jgi:hypothetical protein
MVIFDKPESYHISLLPRKSRSQTVSLLKTCLFSVLFLPVLLASQPVGADTTPIEKLNAGINDAWVSADAPFQGMFITVFPNLDLVFAAWFTFDSSIPASEASAEFLSRVQQTSAGSGSFTKSLAGLTAIFGADDQRWVTALGSVDGNKAALKAELTTGGIFNSNAGTPVQDTNYGTIDLEFASCEQATVTFNFPAAGESGEFVVNRVLNSNVALCEALKPVPNCMRAEPDSSHGPDNPVIVQ